MYIHGHQHFKCLSRIVFVAAYFYPPKRPTGNRSLGWPFATVLSTRLHLFFGIGAVVRLLHPSDTRGCLGMERGGSTKTLFYNLRHNECRVSAARY